MPCAATVKNKDFRAQVPARLRRTLFLNFLALFLLLLGSSGCITSHAAAKRIVDAPNLHDSHGLKSSMAMLWTMLQTNFDHLQITNSLVYRTVPVGPPAAELNIIEVPPKDYHLKIFSKLDITPHKNYLTAWMVPDTNSASQFTPLERPATIFLLHGYMLSKESMIPWAFLLAQAGYRVVLVDLRGHGQSTGDTVSFGKYETADLEQVLDYLTARHECDDLVGVMGFSYGATLALHWAAHDPRIRTVVAIAPYNHPDEAFLRLARELHIPITRRTTEQAVALASARLNLNWADWSGEAAIRQVRVPVLLIGGGKDTISRPDDIVALKKAAGGESKIILIPLANHFSLSVWFHKLGDPVKTWFQTNLVFPAKPAGAN